MSNILENKYGKEFWSYSTAHRRDLAMSYMYSTIAKEVVGASYGKEFAATPKIENILVEKMVEHGGWFFQQQIARFLQVIQLKGSKIAMSVAHNIARTHDTTDTGTPREPVNAIALGDTPYECKEILHDLKIPYLTIDQWVEFSPNFMQMYNRLLRESIASSLIKIGWEGTSRAAVSDIVTNTNMQDVAIGWLEKIRSWNAANPNQGTEGDPLYAIGGGTPISIGSGGTYVSLDDMVQSMKHSIPSHLRNNLIVLASDGLVGDAKGRYYAAKVDTPTEKIAIAQNMGTVFDTYGGLRTIVPPFFPAGTVLVTRADNLFIYMQRSSVRRTSVDKPEYSALFDYNSAYYDYVVYEENAANLIENVTLV